LAVLIVALLLAAGDSTPCFGHFYNRGVSLTQPSTGCSGERMYG